MRLVDDFTTEGIKYAGSKQKLIPQILSLVRETKSKVVLDGFSGTTRVSQALARNGYSVISNDAAIWSEIFANCYLINKKSASYYQPMIDHLNALKPRDGWFSENYGGVADEGKIVSISEDGLKKSWQLHNTRKLDSIREEIDKMKLPFVEKSVLLTSLIRALDEVDNTLGHFSSYLHHWSRRSYKDMKLKVPTLIKNKGLNQVFRSDIFDLLPKVEVDLAYFDPPYGSNNEKMPPSRIRYSAYYHIWKSVCLNDKPQTFGKAKRRSDSSDSLSSSMFEEFRKNEEGNFVAVEAIKKITKEVRAKYVLLSYSSGGRATSEQLQEAMLDNGKLMKTIKIDHKKNVMANMRWTDEWIKESDHPHQEFLFLMKK